MKLIAKHTVNLGNGKSASPGSEFEVDDAEEIQALLDAGAAERKTRVVADDTVTEGNPIIGPGMPASGATRAPDPGKVAQAARR